MSALETVSHAAVIALPFIRRIEGLVLVLAVVLAVWANRYGVRKKPGNYYLDPFGASGAFEPLLQKYLHLAEFVITLATGSIVLLAGSSFLHGKDGRLPGFYATPLLILAGSVLTAILFMVALVYGYENVKHGNPHTPVAYALNETLGFSSLLLFVVGYVWLIIAITA